MRIGEPLREIAELVLTRTRRGRYLAEHPLYLVGADISPESCAQTRRALADLDGRSGVRTAVLEADVADPDRLEQDVRRWDPAVGLADLLHTQMFLLHDRELRRLDAAVDVVDPLAVEDALTRLGEAGLDAAFTVDQASSGRLVPAVSAAADLSALMRRWRPYLPHGLLMVEAHVPRLTDLDDAAIEAGVDPAPAVWGVHAASGQYLMPHLEHELAMAVAGLAPVFSAVTGTSGVSAAHWVDSRTLYAPPAAVPDLDWTAAVTAADAE